MPATMHSDVLGMIGNTPVVDVSNLSPNPNVRILAKMEMQNPFGSVKDRIANHCEHIAVHRCRHRRCGEIHESFQPGQLGTYSRPDQ